LFELFADSLYVYGHLYNRVAIVTYCLSTYCTDRPIHKRSFTAKLSLLAADFFVLSSFFYNICCHSILWSMYLWLLLDCDVRPAFVTQLKDYILTCLYIVSQKIRATFIFW